MKRFFPILSILSVLAILAVAGAAIIEVPEAIGRNISVIVGGSPPTSGPAPGTLLLGNNNTTTSADATTLNDNTAYYMCHTGQATANIATAYYYDRLGMDNDNIHVCVWNSSGTLLGCSNNIDTNDSAGWRSASWNGTTSITASTSYVIGIVSNTGFGNFVNYDESSPALPSGNADTEGVTFGSEGDITVETCNSLNGSYTIYVTN